MFQVVSVSAIRPPERKNWTILMHFNNDFWRQQKNFFFFKSGFFLNLFHKLYQLLSVACFLCFLLSESVSSFAPGSSPFLQMYIQRVNGASIIFLLSFLLVYSFAYEMTQFAAHNLVDNSFNRWTYITLSNWCAPHWLLQLNFGLKPLFFQQNIAKLHFLA